MSKNITKKATGVSKGVSDMLERAMAGNTPVFNTKKTKDDIEIDIQVMHALNWYTTMSNDAKERSWFLAFASQKSLLTKQECSKAKDLDAAIFVRAGRYAHMMSNGFPIDSWAMGTLKECVERVRKRLAAKPASSETVTVKSGPSIQDRINDKASEHVGTLASHIDEFLGGILSGTIKKSDDETFFSITSYLNANEIKPLMASKILDMFQVEVSEWASAAKDPEGYEYLTESQIKRMLRFVSWIEEGLKLRVAEKQKTTKTRKKKQKSPVDLAKKAKYLPKTELYGGIESITPDKIIGSEKAIIFNVKNNEYTIYEAKDKIGLSIKGSTIQNFDETKSFSKKIRANQVKSILDTTQKQGIRATKNAIDAVKTKQSVPNGRTNANLIIMKVYK